MFGNKNSIYFILLPFKGTATLFQLLKNISFTFLQDFRARLLLPEVQTWIYISKSAVGHCSNLWVWGTAKPKAPGFNGHVPESNTSANETCWRPQKIFSEKLGTDFCAWGRKRIVFWDTSWWKCYWGCWQKYLRPPSVLIASSPKSVNIPISWEESLPHLHTRTGGQGSVGHLSLILFFHSHVRNPSAAAIPHLTGKHKELAELNYSCENGAFSKCISH